MKNNRGCACHKQRKRARSTQDLADPFCLWKSETYPFDALSDPMPDLDIFVFITQDIGSPVFSTDTQKYTRKRKTHWRIKNNCIETKKLSRSSLPIHRVRSSIFSFSKRYANPNHERTRVPSKKNSRTQAGCLAPLPAALWNQVELENFVRNQGTSMPTLTNNPIWKGSVLLFASNGTNTQSLWVWKF